MPLSEENSIDYWGNDMPKCPHCDKDIDIGDNDLWELYNDDDSHDIECPHCEKEFRVITDSSWTFNTDEQE